MDVISDLKMKTVALTPLLPQTLYSALLPGGLFFRRTPRNREAEEANIRATAAMIGLPPTPEASGARPDVAVSFRHLPRL